ncbi:sulfate ABC transporter substrate-binding protein, partial [Mycobacterium kansasii]
MDIRTALRWRPVLALVSTAGVAASIAGCHGGASDAVGGGGLAGARTSITLVAYSVPEPGW